MKYGILVVCFIFALLSYVNSILFLAPPCEKKRPKTSFIIFYFILYVFVVSFFQCVTGDTKEPFINCFSEATYRTYIRYSIILLPCAIMIPPVYMKLFREKAERFICHFIGCFILLFVPEYAFFIKSQTLLLCILVAVAAIYGLTVTLFVKETSSEKTDIKKKADIVLPCVLWGGMTYILYIPNQTILSNLSQIPIKYTTIFFASLVLFLLFTIVYGAIGILLPGRYASAYSLIFFGLTLCGYIQYNFLNTKMDMLTGEDVSYSPQTIWINAALWIAILLVIFTIGYLLRKKTHGWYKYISYLFTLTQLVAFVAALFTSDFRVQQTGTLTIQRMNEFAKTDNAVVFVLDCYDEQILDMVLEEDADFLSPLSDFTHYDNTVSEFAHTYMVLPYMLTGIEWQDGMPEESYLDYANENSFFLEHVQNAGYECDIYTASEYIKNPLKKIIRNWNDDLKLNNSFASFPAMWEKISRYNTLPYIIAKDFYYTAYDLELVIKDSGKYIWGDDTVIYHSVADNGIFVDPNVDKLFKLIHMYGVHRPYYMTEQYEILLNHKGNLKEQARASLRIVYKYIEEMKEKGIYDNAAIIITADHGDRIRMSPGKERTNTSSPMLLVKEPGETHSELHVSKAPVTLHEMLPTLLRSMGDESYRNYGRCYDEVAEDEQRTRYYRWGNPPTWMPYETYQIDGDIQDINNWKLIDTYTEK